jgi:corrinoid protein of di/trimethylamine methyltransferase
MSKEILARLEKSVMDMDEDSARSTAQEILAQKIDVGEAVNDGLIKGMKAVAELYDKEEIYLPQVLASANAFYAAFDILRPHMLSGAQNRGKKVVIGVVEGDIHDIGKNLVKTMIEANGYDCVDLGRDVPIEDFVGKVSELSPEYVAMSTLMTPTMKSMRRIIEGMNDEDCRDECKVLIGGGPIDAEFATDIGADFYGKDESDAISWLKTQDKL